MSDELNQLKDDLNAVVKAPRMKEAFDAAKGTWPVAATALGAGILIKPLLPVAFLAAAGYAVYEGVKAYANYDDGGDKGGPTINGPM